MDRFTTFNAGLFLLTTTSSSFIRCEYDMCVCECVVACMLKFFSVLLIVILIQFSTQTS